MTRQQKKILSQPLDKLSKKQVELQTQLQVLPRGLLVSGVLISAVQGNVGLQIQELTGITKASFLNPATDANLNDPPIQRLKVDLSEDVNHFLNKQVIERTVKLVWDEQSVSLFRVSYLHILILLQDPTTCSLDHKDVPFTRVDLADFAKTKLCGWRKKYRQSIDEELAKKQRHHESWTRRMMRQRQVHCIFLFFI